MEKLTVEKLIKELQKIENKKLKIELVYRDWTFYNYSFARLVYDNSDYTNTVRITNAQ